MKFLFTTNLPTIRYGLGKALQEMGQNVKIVDLSSVFRQDPASLKELLSDFSPDYVITDGGWYNFWDSLRDELAMRSIPHIYWAREDPIFFDSLSLPYARSSRFVFTTANECIPDYEAHGIPAHLMMFACLPSFHRRVSPDSRFFHDLILIGTNFARFEAREKGIDAVLRPLVEKGYDLRLYGDDKWLNQTCPFHVGDDLYGGKLCYEETPVAYSSSRIILGIHSVDTSFTMMSMRTFEILGCGAFFLTQWTPAIENLFQNHTHLVWTKSPAETLDLVNYYLAHDAERSKIARQGQTEVYAKHTYIHRARNLLRVIQKYQDSSPRVSRAYSVPSAITGNAAALPVSVKNASVRYAGSELIPGLLDRRPENDQ